MTAAGIVCAGQRRNRAVRQDVSRLHHRSRWLGHMLVNCCVKSSCQSSPKRYKRKSLTKAHDGCKGSEMVVKSLQASLISKSSTEC